MKPWRKHGPGSVGRRLAAMSLALSGLMFVITVVGLMGLVGQRERVERNTLVVAPAYDATRSVRQTMVEAQSGLRGFMVVERAAQSGMSAAVVRRPADVATFVQPYLDARSRIGGELAELDRLLQDDRLSASAHARGEDRRLALEQRRASDAWWAYAEHARRYPLIPSAELDRGRRLFVDFSRANDAISAALAAERESLREELRRTVVVTAWAVVAATAGAVVLALFVGWRTTGALTGPLLALRDTVRRQRQGDRGAWAHTHVGAAEVRDLARDVNALTAAQHELADGQNRVLSLQQAEYDVLRKVRDVGNLRSALIVAVGGVAKALGVDRVVAGELDDDGRFTTTVIWEGEAASADYDMPEPLREAMTQVTHTLWAGDRRLAVDDAVAAAADGALRGLPEDLITLQPAGGFVIMPFGAGDRPIGAIAVHSRHAPRHWTDSEIGFIHHVVAELAHRVIAFERDRDRTEHVRRLEDLDRQKDSFLSTVSHELRTPLTSIAGYLEMLEDGDAGPLTPDQLKMVGVVGRNAQRLRGLIEDLLVLNRLEASVHAETAELLAPGDLAREVSEELRPVASRGGVVIITDELDAGPVRGDRAQLGRALTNVVSNAVKFTPAGGTVRLACRQVEDGAAVEISCTDTGIGIPEAEQERLFTRFFRASNATRAQVQGTGLGLVIVRGIVERHGGRLSLTSAEGAGTTIRMTLPARPAPANAQR